MPVWFLLAALASAGPACAQSVAAPAGQSIRPSVVRHVDRAQLMRDVTTLSAPALEGRAAGSPGGVRARRWLVEQFRGIPRLAPLHPGGFEQPFAADGRPVANIVGRFAGRDAHARVIVVTAHYDHLGVRNGIAYAGADDNASGVAALLGVARFLSTHPPRHPVIVAALDAEEIGQRGASALLQWDAFPRHHVALNINLDMVSRSDANELFAAGTSYSPWAAPVLRAIQPRVGVTIRFGHDRPRSATGQDDWTRLSDHAPFHDAGIPFIYFGVEDHGDYHKPTDTADRIDARFFGDAADAIIEALRAFDDALPAG
jgi:Zn-dependent M28 family amino/carboxypeptidase